IGQTVSLNQIPYTVIGVLPPGALLQDDPMFVIPFIIDVDSDTVKWRRDYGCCGALGRVAPGVAVADAQAELRGVRERLAAEYPPSRKDWSVMTVPLQEDLTGDIRPMLSVLLATV